MKHGEKNAQEQCTIVHKQIMGRPLMDRYTLVSLDPNKAH